VRRHAIELDELQGADTERSEEGRVDARQRSLGRCRDHVIEAVQPAQGAVDELGQQPPVALVEPRAGAGEQPIDGSARGERLVDEA